MNTEMKHTPTPWVTTHFDTATHSAIRSVGTPGHDLHVAFIDGRTKEENNANAEFITLACNSYHPDQAKIKALTEALEAVSRRHPGTGGIGDIARAALSLAKS